MCSDRLEAGSSDPARRHAGPEGPASIAFIAAFWLLTDVAIFACPVCFQVEDTGITNGVRAAVLVLGGVTAVVLGGVGLFVRRLVKAEPR